ncbi:hypothetical protein S40293_11068 [Stachybotrys chartarum IBT 40293]|nr:hypothetical protein S40293_11068 [Stachybotrys chartarum IBT 40293]
MPNVEGCSQARRYNSTGAGGAEASGRSSAFPSASRQMGATKPKSNRTWNASHNFQASNGPPPPPSAKIRQSCRIFARDLRLYVIPSPTSNDAEQPSSATVDGAVLSWLVLALPCWQSLLVDDPCRRPTSTEQGPANPLEIPRFESHLAKDWSPSRVRRSPSRHQSRWSLVSLQHARPYADSMSPLPAGLH